MENRQRKIEEILSFFVVNNSIDEGVLSLTAFLKSYTIIMLFAH